MRRRAGDVEASFADFVSASLPELLRFGHMLAGSREAGEDLVQTALVSTLAAWSGVERRDDPFAYVRRAMVNANITAWRRWASRVTYGEPTEPAQEDHASDVALRGALRDALAALPRRQRTVLVLRYYCDLSDRDIAELMGTRQGTVKSQASRALAKLREGIDVRPHTVERSSEVADGG